MIVSLAESLVIAVIVIAAAVYVLIVMRREWRGRSGCGGCDAARKTASDPNRAHPQTFVPLERLTKSAGSERREVGDDAGR